MAIAPTGAIFKSLEFDGEDSRNYGIYITGEAVFNAPTRDAEAIVIPGRNGTFIRDNGRFDNISVTYPAGCYASTETDFAAAISAFRNMLCSRVGYKRLEDDYNPDEYREAVYKSGLEVTPSLLKSGEFSITFECKPQRFLKSGETAMAVMDGATLTNPTRFDAKPMIEAKGYGQISLAGQIINVSNSPMGTVQLRASETTVFSPSNPAPSISYSFDGALLNPGDSIDVGSAGFHYKPGGTGVYTGLSVTNVSGFDYAGVNQIKWEFDLNFYNISLTKGTSFTKSGSATINYTYNGSTGSQPVTCTFAYDGNQTITLSLPQFSAHGTSYGIPSAGTSVIMGESSLNVTDTMFIDCENGLAWWDVSGTIVDANNVIEFPPALPVLNPGANVINFDNTFTSFKIAPRWWIV